MSAKTNAEAFAILANFSRDVARLYGAELKGVFLFGSRARGDQTPDSDADVAIILAGEAVDFWREKTKIGDIAYEYLLETGLYIQDFPFAEGEWTNPPKDRDLILAAKEDAVDLLVQA